MVVYEIFERYGFWKTADRIGPDIPLTHWKLYLKSTMRRLCIRKFKRFGEGAEFRPGAYAISCSKITIGDYVIIRPGTFLFADPVKNGGEIIIEEKVLIGSGVHFYTNNHDFSDTTKPIYDQGHQLSTKSNTIILRKGCWIGAGVIILPGVEVGQNSVVGAGSVLTKSIPSGVVAVGNPARVLKNI